MHHQAAQKSTELLQNNFKVLINMAVIENIVIFATRRSHPVIDTIKAHGNTYYDCHDGQGVKEGRKEGCSKAERE